jgi:hypothetical protein
VASEKAAQLNQRKVEWATQWSGVQSQKPHSTKTGWRGHRSVDIPEKLSLSSLYIKLSNSGHENCQMLANFICPVINRLDGN